MKNQEDFNKVVRTLTQKVKSGDEWKINLSQELMRYQEYAQCSEFGESFAHRQAVGLTGNFVEAGLVVENASSIFSLRVDSAYKEVIKCAQSLTKSILNSEKPSASQEEKTSIPKKNDENKTPKVKQKKSVDPDLVSQNFNLLHQMKNVHIKTDSEKREISNDNLVSGFKFIPPYLNKRKQDKKICVDPANTEFFNTFNEVTSYKFDYMMNTNDLMEYEDIIDEDTVAENTEEPEPERRQSCSGDSDASFSIVDSGFGSLCSSSSFTGSSKQDSLKDIFQEFLTYLDDTITNFLASNIASYSDVNQLIESVNPIRKNLEILIENSKDISSNQLKGNTSVKHDLRSINALMQKDSVNKEIARICLNPVAMNVKDVHTVIKDSTMTSLAKDSTNIHNQDLHKENNMNKTASQNQASLKEKASDNIIINKEITVETKPVSNESGDKLNINLLKVDLSLLTSKVNFDYSQDLFEDTTVGFLKIPMHVLHKIQLFDYSQIINLKRNRKTAVMNTKENPIPEKMAKINSKPKSATMSNESITSEKHKKCNQYSQNNEINNISSSTVLSLDANASECNTIVEQNDQEILISNKESAVKSFDDFEDLGVWSPEGEFPIDSDFQSDADRPSTVSLNEILPQLKPVSMLNRLDKDLNEMLLNRKLSADKGYEAMNCSADAFELFEDSVMSDITASLKEFENRNSLRKDSCDVSDEGYFESDSLASLMIDKSLIQDQTVSSTNNDSILSNQEMFSSTPQKEAQSQRANLRSVSPILQKSATKLSDLSKNRAFFEQPKSLKEKYCIPDSSMDNRIQEWRKMIDSNLENDKNNVYQLKTYKKFLLYCLSKVKGRKCTLGDFISCNSDVGNGRFLLAALQLINERQIQMIEINTEEFDDPNKMSLKIWECHLQDQAGSSGIQKTCKK